jgi:hypothetical protein
MSMIDPAPPTPRGQAPLAPPAPPRPVDVRERRWRSPGRKRRVNVSLPFELSRALVKRSDAEGRYLTDMVMEAFLTYTDDVGPNSQTRRRVARGRITHMLYLTADEVEDIDGAAARRGMARSAFVARLLERLLGPGS